MKKRISRFMTLVTLLTCGAVLPACQDAGAKEHRAASTVGTTHASFATKRCINLGNALEAPQEGDWGYTIREKDLTIIANAGFDTVRLPIRWDTHTNHRRPYAVDPAFMNRIKKIVAMAQSRGLHVIIDVHHFERLMTHTRFEKNRYFAIWEQIAQTFANAPDDVYFELLNEPTNDMSMNDLNGLYKELIPLIRTSNPTRTLILGGNSWNSLESLAEVAWPNDAHLVATFHDYGPHEFTHQGAEWTQPVMKLGRVWGGKSDQRELHSTYKQAVGFARKNPMPVFIGEFGVIDKVPQDQRNAWLKARRRTMEAQGFSWCMWDYAGAFKSYDFANDRWLPGVRDALFSNK
jgi:endoglucanase